VQQHRRWLVTMEGRAGRLEQQHNAHSIDIVIDRIARGIIPRPEGMTAFSVVAIDGDGSA